MSSWASLAIKIIIRLQSFMLLKIFPKQIDNFAKNHFCETLCPLPYAMLFSKTKEITLIIFLQISFKSHSGKPLIAYYEPTKFQD